MGDVVMQHYVPQFYLQSWVKPGEKNLWVFDKTSGKVFPASPSQVGGENWFYHEAGESQWLENALSRMEGNAAKSLRRLQQTKDFHALKFEEMGTIDIFLVIQWMRGLGSRIDREHMVTAMREEFGPIATGEFREELEGADGRHFHLQGIASCQPLVESMIKLNGCFTENKTAKPFTTSDSPIVLSNRFPPAQPWMSNIGLECFGIHVSIPLSPRLELTKLDSRPWPGGETPRRLQAPGERDILEERTRQFVEARRFIYSRDNDFEHEAKLLAEHPEEKDPNRVRLHMGHPGENIAAKHAERSKYPPAQPWRCLRCGKDGASCRCGTWSRLRVD